MIPVHYRYGRSAWSFASRLDEARRWGIGPTDLVLDVGSGQEPHPRANVLVDRFADDHSERAVGARLVFDRTAIIADAQRLPFPDDSFDFVICKHLLEHVAEPETLFSELTRVARRGYIETPSRLYEKLHGWRFHRWFVHVADGRIVLEAKERAIFDPDLHSWFRRELEEPDFWSFFMPRLRRLGLLTAVLWDGDIPYEIRRDLASDPDAEEFAFASGVADRGDEGIRRSSFSRARSHVSTYVRRRSDPRVPDIMRRLTCPACGSPLTHGERLDCRGCDRSFGFRGQVPWLVVDQVVAA